MSSALCTALSARWFWVISTAAASTVCFSADEVRTTMSSPCAHYDGVQHNIIFNSFSSTDRIIAFPSSQPLLHCTQPLFSLSRNVLQAPNGPSTQPQYQQQSFCRWRFCQFKQCKPNSGTRSSRRPNTFRPPTGLHPLSKHVWIDHSRFRTIACRLLRSSTDAR